MKIFLYTSLVFIYFIQLCNCNSSNPTQSYHFECETRKVGNNDERWCCGIAADGKRMCSKEANWGMHGGKRTYCKGGTGNQSYTKQRNGQKKFGDPDNRGRAWDICCDDELIGNCGQCKSFVVFPWPTQDELLEMAENQRTDPGNPREILNRDWYEADFLQQEDPVGKNEVYPAGFMHATLQEYNNPPVCIYVPNSAGKVIEVKVEPDEKNSRMCISDLHDDTTNRNDPGQNTTCDDFRLLSCFADGGKSDTSLTQKKRFCFLYNL